MYAIVRSGGKQYRVAEKKYFDVEKLEAEDGQTLELTDVLLVADENGVRLGAPLVEGARVVVRVMGTFKGVKIHGYTYKPTKSVQRHYGHRQFHTRLMVESITG